MTRSRSPSANTGTVQIRPGFLRARQSGQGRRQTLLSVADGAATETGRSIGVLKRRWAAGLASGSREGRWPAKGRVRPEANMLAYVIIAVSLAGSSRKGERRPVRRVGSFGRIQGEREDEGRGFGDARRTGPVVTCRGEYGREKHEARRGAHPRPTTADQRV